MITSENIELFLFRYKEGLLTPDERVEVEQALASHPEWQEMADLYEPEMKLPAGATMPFEDWKSLRDGGPKARKTIAIGSALGHEKRRVVPMWLSFAAAACLLLFITSIVRFVNQSPVITPQGMLVAKVDTAKQRQSFESVDDIEDQPIMHKSIVRQQPQEEHNLLASNENVNRQVANDSPVREPKQINDQQEHEAVPNREMPVREQMPSKENPSAQVEPDTLPSVESINKENQKIYYADNVIEWVDDDSKEFETPQTRRQQLRHLAKHATAVIANAANSYEENKNAIGDVIEERIKSSQFLNGLLAAIDD